MLVCLTVLLLMLISEHQSVLVGARCGLMLWYRDVLPLLLPFMLLSNLFVLELQKRKIKRGCAVCILLLLGLLCGYPLGAKTAADFTQEHLISRRHATILLPLVNNVSPMFLSGYICHIILQDHLPFWQILLLLYLPCILLTAGILLLTDKHDRKRAKPNVLQALRYKQGQVTHPCASSADTAPDSILLASVIQITCVGLYIMICSILFHLICDTAVLPASVTDVFCGLLEVTQGSARLAASGFPERIRIALILACTSFGGISALLQTVHVTRKSGLSMCYYVFLKLMSGGLSGVCTYFLL